MRSFGVPPRGVLTDNLIDYLEGICEDLNPPVLVGDGQQPVKFGWSGGQPGMGSYFGSIVVTAGPVSHNLVDPAAAPSRGWVATYTLLATGATRSMADSYADRIRPVVGSLKEVSNIAPEGWGLMKVTYDSLGGVARSDSTGSTTPTWEVRDTVSIWLEGRR